jgi:hypothetical protein
MPNKPSPLVLLMIAASSVTTVHGSGMSTLFTTPQERQLINAKRYKLDEVPLQAPQNLAKSVATNIQKPVQEWVRELIRISGITLSSSGHKRVWINSQVYEDGDSIDDKMPIKVMVEKEIVVRITAPDGKHYFVTSGETIEIVYQLELEKK